MQDRFFGTDGIRGRFGVAPLDRETVPAIGKAVVGWLRRSDGPPGARSLAPPRRLRIVLGGDTRESTPQLARWLMEGFADDVEVRWGGILPTPALALLVRELEADLAIALSASHNPFHDNGIKFFDHNGFKFDDATEQAIEARIHDQLRDAQAASPALESQPQGVDGATAVDLNPGNRTSLPPLDPSLERRYFDYLVATADAGALANLKVVLDAGHGAASALAEPVFQRLGANTQLHFADPDGRNINANCGSTAPDRVASVVAATSANLGFAFDGDADRVIVIDENGKVRDGDEVLYLWGKALAMDDDLPSSAIVATSMSNLGLERALAAENVSVQRCDVGDRAVVAMLRQQSLRLGGEQSGHIVDLQRSTTGDGLLTAIAIAGIVESAAQPLSQLLSGFQRFPQRLENVVVRSKPPLESIPEIAEAARVVEAELGDSGRLVLRYSGTEPLARVMVEAEDQATVNRHTEALAEVIRHALG